ncbi:hypothetical protein WA026_021064 [Henosepilachna vigintioctopunctata]|uniref:DDE Tnp4 domain-containing protein n=1 Tax=Henosepilachna vigintioctopunctata TaxID=420089 RepID=A0AAW1V543_9CUCU
MDWYRKPTNPQLLLEPQSVAINYKTTMSVAINTRCVNEGINGLLKMLFRCLLKHQRKHHCHPEVAAHIITACEGLHNICIEYVSEPEDGDDSLHFGIFYDEDRWE